MSAREQRDYITRESEPGAGQMQASENEHALTPVAGTQAADGDFRAATRQDAKREPELEAG
jgi:hypothetical protein